MNGLSILATCLAVAGGAASLVLGDVNDPGRMARAALSQPTGPDPKSNPTFAAPIKRWDEGIPLGNGLLGGLLWGGGTEIKLSLDRGDLWDLRTPKPLQADDWTYATIQKLVKARDQKTLVARFDRPYNAYPYPTKIPAGRLELTLPAGREAKTFGLDLAGAVGSVDLAGGGKVDVFYSAAEPLAVLRVRGAAPTWRIVAPAALKKLGYAPPQTGESKQPLMRWTVQEAALGLTYAVVVGERTTRDKDTILAVTVTSTKDGADPLAIGKQRVGKALASTFDGLRTPHAAWWKTFWQRSSVRVPDLAYQRHYDFVQYLYGAGSRRGAPPLPLQGVWTADQGTLPPWKGDYHHDLNTQFTYYAYQTAGRFDQGACFLDFMWNLLPQHREFARRFYGTGGAAVPGVMTLDGKAMGGWSQYSLSPTMGAWVAHLFYLHWRYTADARFLRERAYPYCAAIAECLLGLLKPGAHGTLKLPLSTSPEIHNNSLAAWLTPNTNHDLALLRWLFSALAEMAEPAGHAKDAARWRGVLARLDDWAVEDKTPALKLSPTESLRESHRHHAHLMAIHPLGLLNVEGGERARKIIDASLTHTLALGTKAWCGYSFSWMACMLARAGRGDEAAKYLGIYLDAFLSRNGFHINGNQTRKGYSNFHYRPFTLEGNFAAGQAVHEMLLQSWRGVVRLFPALPKNWYDVSFAKLRAEGGYEVSAARVDGVVWYVRVTATADGVLRLRNPFGRVQPTWTPAPKRSGAVLEFPLRAGQSVTGRVRIISTYSIDPQAEPEGPQ